MIEFLTPMLPTEEEYRIKESIRRQLMRIASQICPEAQLQAFGSMANGFALRNSDMDLCCLIPPRTKSRFAPRSHDSQDGSDIKNGKVENGPSNPSNPSDGSVRENDSDAAAIHPGDTATKVRQPSPSELVEQLSDLIRKQTDFQVLPLPKARIPIIKVSRAASSDIPCDIACDIGFNNQLALENTRLLLSYAMLDPPRLRALVLFIKVWTKRRKLNSPYMGTLSSYGYTLLVLFFLIHVKLPPVLPNLQRIPAGRDLPLEDIMLDGHNIYFYDDMDALRQHWHSDNTESLGELLLDFFRYFSRDFNYTKDAISMRTEGGLVTKESRGWTHDLLCIEDPFQLGYNVARTVTKDGLYTIRGEFMRASRLLANRSIRAPQLLSELCTEREEGLTHAPDFPHHRSRPHGRLSNPSYRDPLRDSTLFPVHMPFDDMTRGFVHGVSYPPSAGMLGSSTAVPYGLPGMPVPMPLSHHPLPPPPLPPMSHASDPQAPSMGPSMSTSPTPSSTSRTSSHWPHESGPHYASMPTGSPFMPMPAYQVNIPADSRHSSTRVSADDSPSSMHGHEPLSNGMQDLSLDASAHPMYAEWSTASSQDRHRERDDDDDVFGMSPT